MLTLWLLSTAVTGARGDLKDIGRMQFCPVCRDITDNIFDLSLQMCEAVTP